MSDGTLLELGERTLTAAAAVAEELLGAGAAAPVDASVDVASDPFGGLELPAIVAEVPFDDGAGGTFVLVLTSAGALRVAAALGAIDEEAAEMGGSVGLGEPELGAVGQLADKIAVAAGDDRFEVGRSRPRIAEVDGEVRRALAPGTRAVQAAITVLGEPARLVQVMPSGALLRIEHEPDVPVAEGNGTPLGAVLHDVDVRVWAELGRTRMPTGQVVGLPGGAIVELDREAEDAVDLYVDGQLYATGRLVVCDDDSWGVRVERVLGLRA